MIEFDKRYLFQMPVGTISEKGIELLLSLIGSQDLSTDAWKSENPNHTGRVLPQLPDNWQWVWVVQRGEYAGTMPKRISSYYYKQHKIKSPDVFLTQIGNIARQHSENQTQYDFEFVKNLNWNAGDYGDKGSCFFGGRSEARRLMMDNGAFAVRFYEGDKGIARAWMYEVEPGLYVLFNGYGFANATLTIARVVATFLSMTYKKIPLSNHGNTSGTLYINSNNGYAIGLADTLASIDDYDFEWGDVADECSACGEMIEEHEVYIGTDDEYYCETCFYDRFDNCYDCGETFWREDMYWVESMEREVCTRCLDRSYGRCEGCDEYFRYDDLAVYQDESYCRACYDDLEIESEDESEE